MHRAAAIELAVNPRGQKGLFGFEVIVERTAPGNQAGGLLNLIDAGRAVTLLAEKPHGLADQSFLRRGFHP
jgi:hypothetical protein